MIALLLTRQASAALQQVDIVGSGYVEIVAKRHRRKPDALDRRAAQRECPLFRSGVRRRTGYPLPSFSFSRRATGAGQTSGSGWALVSKGS